MMKSIRFALVILLFGSVSLAQQGDNLPHPLSVAYDLFVPNRNAIWFGNNGLVGHNPQNNSPGWEWPAGSGKTVGFEMGLVWAATISGSVRAGGSTYNHALQPGILDASGNADNPQDPRFRVYHIRREDALTGTNPDYNQWPVGDGAPADGKGKPYFYGDQQLWFVSNDKDGALTSSLFGSPPIGLELQTTVWGFSDNPLLADVLFVKNLFINKSNSRMDQAYVGLWADLDIGNPLDDLAGVDTLLGLEYMYNGAAPDAVYGLPPSAGLIYLQTPTVPSNGDTVVVRGIPRPGFRYCSPAGFSFYVNGSGLFADPTTGAPSGTTMLYNNLRGYLWNGQPVTNPFSGKRAAFPFAGDPLLARDWLDGTISSDGTPLPAGDRRMLLSAGPFTLAPGDTQEVVYAMLVKQGGDRIESVKLLKESAEYIRFFYRRDQRPSPAPRFDIAISYPSMYQISLAIEVVDSLAIGGNALLLRPDGTIFSDIPLYDDGNHGDGAAGDHRFAGTWSSTVQPEGVDAFLSMTYPGPMKYRWYGRRCTPLAGAVRITGVHVEADNLNRDFRANPGENLRVSLDVSNATPFDLGAVDCIPLEGATPGRSIYRISAPFASGSTVRRSYADPDSGRYTSVDVPATAIPGTEYRVPFLINDARGNSWLDTALIPIHPLPFPPIDSLALHIAGSGQGTLGWRIVHPGEWKDRLYRITIRHLGIEGRLVSVFDSAERRIRAADIRLPDAFAHDFPIVDGFQVTQGTILRPEIDPLDPATLNVPPLKTSYEPVQNSWLVPVQGYGWIPGKNLYGTALTACDLKTVKLVFSKTNQQNGYLFLRGGTPNYGCTGWGTVPFRVFDMSDSLHPRQINVGFVEQKGNAFQDAQWLPGLASSDREILFIFNSSYTGVLDTAYTSKKPNADGYMMDIQYVGWFTRKQATDTFREGDIQWIVPTVPVSRNDTFIVNGKGTISSTTGMEQPLQISFGPNYPNPFSAGTTIRYSLSSPCRVQIRISDRMGRSVVLLMDEEKEAGEFFLSFSPSRYRLPPGVYLCTLTSGGKNWMRKLLYLK